MKDKKESVKLFFKKSILRSNTQEHTIKKKTQKNIRNKLNTSSLRLLIRIFYTLKIRKSKIRKQLDVPLFKT